MTDPATERRSFAIEEAVALLSRPADRAACRERVEEALIGLDVVYSHREAVEGPPTAKEMRDELYALETALRGVRGAFASLSPKTARFFSSRDRDAVDHMAQRALAYAYSIEVERNKRRPALIARVAARVAAELLEAHDRSLSVEDHDDLTDRLIQAVTDERIKTDKACRNERKRRSTTMGDEV